MGHSKPLAWPGPPTELQHCTWALPFRHEAGAAVTPMTHRGHSLCAPTQRQPGLMGLGQGLPGAAPVPHARDTASRRLAPLRAQVLPPRPAGKGL